MKLGVLARAIIVASCFWMAGGTFSIALSLSHEAEAKAASFYEECAKRPNEGYDCGAGREEIYRAHTDQLQGGLWGFAAGLAAIYLTLSLIAFGIIYGSVRWVLAGRSRP